MSDTMNNTETEAIERRLRHAVACARAGGDFTLRHFSTGVMTADRKSDGSPVTIADRGCEELIRGMLREAFPDDGLVQARGAAVLDAERERGSRAG